MNSRCLPSRLMHRAAIACMHECMPLFPCSHRVRCRQPRILWSPGTVRLQLRWYLALQSRKLTPAPTSTCGQLAGQRFAWVPQPQPGHPAGRGGFATRFRRLPVSAQPSDIFIAEAHKLGPFPLSVGQVRLRKVPREVAQQQERHCSRPRVAQ